MDINQLSGNRSIASTISATIRNPDNWWAEWALKGCIITPLIWQPSRSKLWYWDTLLCQSSPLPQQIVATSSPVPKPVVKFLNQCFVLLLPKRALSTAFSDSPLMLGCPFCLDLVTGNPHTFRCRFGRTFCKDVRRSDCSPTAPSFLWSMGPQLCLEVAQ